MTALSLLVAALSTTAHVQPDFVPAMRVGDAVPDTALVDESNRPLSLRRDGGPSIVGFAYTRCTDGRVCSLVTEKFARLQGMLRGTGIRLVEVTLDPGYDRPSVLRRYAAQEGADPRRWIFGTGRPGDVTELSERFGIVRVAEARGLLGHTEALAIVSGRGVLSTLIAGDDWVPKDVAAEARRDAGLRSNPFDRLALGLLSRAGAACGLAGASGPSLLGALAIFTFLVASLGYLALRTCSAAFADRP